MFLDEETTPIVIKEIHSDGGNIEIFNENCQPVNSAAEVGIDDAINLSGSFGRFQIILNVVMFLVYVFNASHMVLLYFVADDPAWSCVHQNTSTFCEEHTDAVIPKTSIYFSERCKMNRSSWKFTNHELYSIVTEFDLVCGNEWLGSLANSALFIGWAIAGPIGGYFMDRHGKRIVLIVSAAASTFSVIYSSFVDNIWQFIVLRGIYGAFLANINTCYFAITFEATGCKHRFITSILSVFAGVSSMLFVLGVAYYFQNWRQIMLFLSFPTVALFFVILFIPESARWLYAKGQVEKAQEELQKIARINQQTHTQICLKTLPGDEHKKHQYNYWDLLFRHLSVLCLVCSSCFLWFSVALLYYGVTFIAADIGGDIYWNFFYLTLAEIPPAATQKYCGNKFGRKKSFIGFLILLTFCLGLDAGLYFVPNYGKKVELTIIAIAVLGKTCAANLIPIIYLWTFELYPTVVRSQGMSLAQIACRVGSAGAPFLATNLGLVKNSLPFIIMTAFGTSSVLLALSLPETNKKNTRENFDDFFQKPEKLYTKNTDC